MAEKKRTHLDPVKAAQAVLALKENLKALDPDGDEDLLADMIEGETDFPEMIDRLLAERAEDLILLKGIEAITADLDVRSVRIKKRIELKKALIEQAMSIAEIDRIERPAATLSMSKRAPKVEILEEADIPFAYFKAPPPVLDRALIAEALKARAAFLDSLPEDPAERAAALAEVPPDVPGACLSNAAPTVTIRPK